MREQSGFTLIELVMVILIAGILSVFAMAKTSFFSGWQEAGSAQAMSSLIFSAQRLAMTNRRAVYVAIGSQSIKACYDAGCSTPGFNYDGTAMALTMPSGSIGSTASSFSFDSEGRPSFTGPFSIVYFGSTVNIEPETGLIW